MVDWNAVINAIISFIIPGLGQAIEGYLKRGLIIFVVFVAFNVLAMYVIHLDYIITRVISTIYALAAAYDAYRLY